MSKGLKYTLIFLAGFILFTALLLLFTQTAFFREKAKEQLIKVVENNLNINLEIEEINGNIFNGLHVKNITFSESDSVVATFYSLKLNYELLPLTNKIISVESVIIENPQINLWQKKDSSWNLKYYLKPKKDKSGKQRKPFNFKINVNHLALIDGNISISSLSKAIPSNIENFNLIADGSISKNDINIQLKRSDFSTEDPSIILKELSGNFNKNKNGIQVDNFVLVTGNSDIDFNGKFAELENMETNVEAGNIDNEELALFIPSIKLLCSPSLNVKFNTVNDTVSTEVELKYNNQSVFARVTLNPFTHLLNKTQPIPYFANLSFNNFRIEDWIEFKNESALIQGEIQLDGTNLLNKNSRAKINANLKSSRLRGISFNTLSLNGIYLQDSLNAIFDAQTDFGEVKITGNLWNISQVPRYDVTIETNKFNLTSFIPKVRGTKFSGTIITEGTGLKASDMNIKAKVQLVESSVYKFQIDTLYSDINFQNSLVTIDTLNLIVPGASGTGRGSFKLDSLLLDTYVHLDVDSLTVLDPTVVLPIKFDSVSTDSRIHGPVSRLLIEGDVDIYNADGYSAKLQKADAWYSVYAKKDSLNVLVKTLANVVEIGPFEWDSLTVDLNYLKPDIAVNVNGIWNDTIDATINAEIRTTDTLTVVIPQFDVKTLLSNYFMEDTLKATFFKKDKLEIENFVLKDQNRDEFILSANGIISTADTNNFKISIKQLDLSQMNKFIQKEDSLKGILSTDIEITGTAMNPEIDGNIDVENPKFGDNGLTSISAKMNYDDQKGFAEFTTPDLDSAFYTSISATFDAYFDSLKFVFSPPDTFEANLILDNLNISQSIEQLVPNDSLNGTLNANIKATGNMKNPMFYGNLDLNNGLFINNRLGINYDYIKTSVVFDGKRIVLDTFLVKQEEGLISVTGDIEFDSTIVKGSIVSSSITADANEFFLTKHRNYEIQIDANTFVKTGNANPEFGGKIKVLRSDVFLPALFPEDKTDEEMENIPMLVKALYTENDLIALQAKLEEEKSKKEKKRTELLNNLSGRLNVEIPRNTWLKSDNMRIELSGDVDIVKTGLYFELFGNIDIIRGHYILYGKKLNIKESEIIFQGGEELDPYLNFVAEYIYRGSDKEKRYLELIVTGKLSEPDITFTLDEAEITETDGISVLIFGATSDEIGYSGQNGLIGSVGSNAVASVITSQLSKTIGTQFNLDMIEVTATENWQSAAFVVGKYITNDIFVIYERGFGEVEGDEITPETITVEYEINEKFFIRLQSGSSKTSGIDLILKFEQEKKD